MDDDRAAPIFTDDQIRTLRIFADNLVVGRRAFRLLAWLGGFIGAVTAFLYYVSGIVQDWHGAAASK